MKIMFMCMTALNAGVQLLAYEMEHKSVLGSNDIKVLLNDPRKGPTGVVIEVDGPFHYANNE